MRKLSLHDRTHAVVVAISRGLIPLPVAPDHPVEAGPRREPPMEEDEGDG